MSGVSTRACAFGDFGAFEILDGVTAALDEERSFVAVESDVVFGVGRRAFVPAAVLPSDGDRARLAREIISNCIVVWSFLIVVRESNFCAAADNPCRIGNAETPPNDVQHVHAVVAQFAVSPMPEPMPVVVHVVGPELALRRGTLPERPVETGGKRTGHAFADGRTAIEVI